MSARHSAPLRPRCGRHERSRQVNEMKALGAFLVGLLSCSISLADKRSGQVEIVRAELTAAYQRFLESELHYNGAKFVATIKDLTAAGKMRDSMLEGAEETAKSGGDRDLIRINSMRFTIVSVTVHDKTATALVKQYADVVRRDTDGQYGTPGQQHHLVGTLTYKDTWHNISGTWKLFDEATVSETGSVDGKPLSENQLDN